MALECITKGVIKKISLQFCIDLPKENVLMMYTTFWIIKHSRKKKLMEWQLLWNNNLIQENSISAFFTM
jgi:hypothetical protein